MIMKYLFGRPKPQSQPVSEPQVDKEALAREAYDACRDNTERCAALRTIGSRKLAKQLVQASEDADLLAMVAGDPELDEGVRAEAKKWIRAIKESHESGAAVKALRRLEAIVAETEARGAAENWYESFGWLEDAQKKWDIYATTAKGADDFESVHAKYLAAREVFNRKLDEQNQLRTIREVWEQLCVRAEALAEAKDDDVNESVRKLDELVAHWDVKEELPPSFANRLNARFEQAAATVRDRAARHAEMQEKRGEVYGELERLAADAEALADAEEIPSAKACHELQKTFELAARPIKGYEGPALTRFDAALKRITDRAAAVDAAKRAALDAKRKEGETLAESMERIAAEPITGQYLRDTQAETEQLIAQFSALALPPKDPVSQRFFKAERHYLNERRALYAAEDQERWANYAVKLKLCEKAESIAGAIADDTDVRELAASLKGLRQDWKNMGPVPKQLNEETWTRFDGVCQTIYNWLKVRFDAEDAVRADNLEIKRKLCEELEALAGDERPMKALQEAFNGILSAWKEAGPVSREEIKPLSERFKAGLDAFSERRKQHYQALDERFKHASSEKEQLITEAEGLKELPWREGFAKIKDLRARWKAAGFSGKKDDALWNAFNGAIDLFFSAQDGQHADNLVAKTKVCETLERVAAECNAESSLKPFDDEVRDAINLWKETGPVGEAESAAILERFRTALDQWHAKRDELFSAMNARREEAQRRKEELIMQAEEVVAADIPQNEKAEKIKALQAQWKESGITFREVENALRDQFSAICNDFFADRRQQFDRLMADRMDNLSRKREICVRLEQLSNVSSNDETPVDDDLNLLAKELQYILSSNITADRPESREERVSQAIELQAKWREIGPVPRQETDAIFTRYRRACDAIFGTRKPRPPKFESTPAEEKTESADSKDVASE